jgi:alkanesulfonate monooxygenase SsuD/methylene tetrahydromethanopterin reductase-like flavin-dependent oxidoreductase (luciferase family)
MRFITITLIVHAPDPVTGEQKSTQDRFREVLGNARLAEDLGFDGFGVGERHERPFISSSSTVMLSHVAALTTRIRLFTAVTTLSLLDPVRAFEDYATLDHLSGGRLELIIGKGNGAAQRDLFRVTPEDQWDRNAESYEVFRRLWENNKITYETEFRPPLHEAEGGRGRCSARSGSGTAAPPAGNRSTWPPGTATRCAARSLIRRGAGAVARSATTPRPPGSSQLPVEEEACMTTTPLTVLDLVPISSGSNAPQALRNSIDLAQQTERLGYARYWFAEHHLNPGVAGTSPAVVLALTAAATSTIRLGSGAVQMGHRTALATVEEFGLLDALHPGRFDLGLGRSGGRPREAKAPALVGGGAVATVVDGRTPNGLLIPPRFDIRPLLGSPRFAMQKTLLQLPHAEPQNYTEQVGDVLALIAGTYRSPEGEEAHVVPGESAALQVWILGSSGGESAEVAGANGLRFAANYHVSPATVLEAADGYRAAFRPSAELDRPYVSVSADVVVAETEAEVRELATGYGLWVRSIRTAEGAIQFPTPEQARRHVWSDAARELVADRVDTQFTGTPGQVADQLERLRDAAEADELIITTITHDHADRVRSYQLLAEEWARR